MYHFSFYEISAQVLPVLYLAVLVEYGLLRQRSEQLAPLPRGIAATAAAWLAIAFAVGEFKPSISSLRVRLGLPMVDQSSSLSGICLPS